jgi:hypothetical protein
MTAAFDIRLKSFNRSFSVLDLAENLPIWKDQTPEIFTTKHGRRPRHGGRHRGGREKTRGRPRWID